jgi:hypothetical protein
MSYVSDCSWNNNLRANKNQLKPDLRPKTSHQKRRPSRSKWRPRKNDATSWFPVENQARGLPDLRAQPELHFSSTVTCRVGSVSGARFKSEQARALVCYNFLFKNHFAILHPF